MPLPASIGQRLRLPVIAAPMFLVSGPELATAACKAGIIGALPALNARTPEDFGLWLEQVHGELAAHPDAGPLAVNVGTARFGGRRWRADMDLLKRYEVPIVITAIGDPTEVVQEVHEYGGIVMHDATTLAHARKAAEVGVDGINVICGGAGGHAGVINPFAFLPQVRAFFDGILCLAGAISDGRSIRAAQVLGADLIYMGTRFIATRESRAVDEYKRMLVTEQTSGVLYTPSVAGMPGNFLRASMARAGLDPDHPPPPRAPHQPDLPEGVKPWRDIWSAGQGVGLIEDVPEVATLVDRLRNEYRETVEHAPGNYGK
jgi:nitronate monooxygenase